MSALADDLAVAGEAARLGGAETLVHYRCESLSVDQGPGGPVTAADRASHVAITEFLSRARPRDPMLSEEADGKPAAADRGRLWVVDPLDGTREFIDGIGEFSVMVGLAIDGLAVLGAVYLPDPGVLYLGITDKAAWRMSDGELEPTSLSCPMGNPNGLRLIRSRSHPDERLQRIERKLAPTSVLLSGSVGVKCARIGEGQADLYVHPVPFLKEWDTCAPEAVLRGAGGRVSDCKGNDLRYGKTSPVQLMGILAGNPETWSHVSSEVARLTSL